MTTARQDITGNVFLGRGRWYARLPLGGGKRHVSQMPWAEHKEQAIRRATFMAELVVEIRSTGDAATIETLPSILERAAKSTDPAELDRLRELVSRIVGGKVVVPGQCPMRAPERDVQEAVGDGTQWLGDTAREAIRLLGEGAVYVVQLGNRMKIGFSGDVPERVAKLRRVARVGAVVHLVMAGDRRVERETHMMFARLCVEPYEWFAVDPTITRWCEKKRHRCDGVVRLKERAK